jgi:tyrosyl-tRNA synthetase
MKTNFIEELKWRGMLHDVMPGTEELLQKEQVKAYVGFDPTADSLGVGNLVPIMMLMHFQRAGHTPVALVGGATGMVGDPSGKSAERNLLDAETLNHNVECQKKQLMQFLDFDNKENGAELVNNYDWFKDFGFLDFIREAGKHITVNYMMAKDSVKSRLETGLSYTEFSYQLIQGYDFYHLWKNKGIKLQMGGSDQWGNITTGTELVRRMGGGEAYAVTTPLIKKADGTKFGKSEGGNIWLDAKRTSPYKFYQFWLNASDADTETYIKIFSIKNREAIEGLIASHAEAPHLRLLQNALADEITVRVHSEEDLENAKVASSILFGKATEESLRSLDADTLLSVFEGVPQFTVSASELEAGIPIIDFTAQKTQVFASNGEARRMIQGNGLAINKTKVNLEKTITNEDLIAGKYVLVQKGKKNYFLVTAE